MAVNQQAVQKEFLERIHIRTMRKDLQRLREADVASESKKITAAAPISTPPQPVAPQPVQKVEIKAPIVTDWQKEKEKRDVVLETAKSRPQEQGAIDQAKKLATEEERQHIFLLESQKNELQARIKASGSVQNPSLALEKNGILIEQKKLQEQIAPLAAQEQKLEAKIQDIQSQENQTVVPSEQKSLGQQRIATEDQLEETEKQRWALEEKMSELQKKLKGLEENYKTANASENALREQVASIDEQLRSVYAGVLDREKGKRAEATKNMPQPVVTKEIKEARAPEFRRNSVLGRAPNTLGAQVPVALKQKIADSAKIEDVQRRKFMEDVERWAASNKK